MPKHPTETWYCWKELAIVEGEAEPRLLTPWADPHLYEHAFDSIFETPFAAQEAKREHEAATTEDWKLVKMTLEVIEFTHS